MFPMLGLKASSDPRQIMDRLKHQPAVFEFSLTSLTLPPVD